MDALVSYLTGHGGPWAFVVLGLLLALLDRERKISELRAEVSVLHQARLTDAKASTEALLKMSEKTHEALEVLAAREEQRAAHPLMRAGRLSRPG